MLIIGICVMQSILAFVIIVKKVPKYGFFLSSICMKYSFIAPKMLMYCGNSAIVSYVDEQILSKLIILHELSCLHCGCLMQGPRCIFPGAIYKINSI